MVAERSSPVCLDNNIDIHAPSRQLTGQRGDSFTNGNSDISKEKQIEKE